MKIISSYENQAMLDALNRGDILAFATRIPSARARSASTRLSASSRRKPVIQFVQPEAAVIDKTTVPNVKMDLVLAPADWTPVYSVTGQVSARGHGERHGRKPGARRGDGAAAPPLRYHQALHGRPALDGVDLDVRAGELHVLFARTGPASRR